MTKEQAKSLNLGIQINDKTLIIIEGLIKTAMMI